MKEVRVQVLKVHQEKILNSSTGIVKMLEERSVDDLGRIFDLYKEVDEGLGPVASAMHSYICQLGNGYIQVMAFHLKKFTDTEMW
jgi:hypothetical protein